MLHQPLKAVAAAISIAQQVIESPLDELRTRAVIHVLGFDFRQPGAGGLDEVIQLLDRRVGVNDDARLRCAEIVSIWRGNLRQRKRNISPIRFSQSIQIPGADGRVARVGRLRQRRQPVAQCVVSHRVPERAPLETAEPEPGRIPLGGGEVAHVLPRVQSALLGNRAEYLPDQIDHRFHIAQRDGCVPLWQPVVPSQRLQLAVPGGNRVQQSPR